MIIPKYGSRENNSLSHFWESHDPFSVKPWVPFIQACFVQFVWNWPSGSGCHFKTLSMYIGSPLFKGHGPSFEQTYIPFTQGCFVPSLVEITSGSGEDGFLNFINAFSLFCYYLGLKKGGTFQLNKLEFPSPKNVVCHACWNWQRDSWEDENEKSLQNRWTDNRRSGKLTCAFSSGELTTFYLIYKLFVWLVF